MCECVYVHTCECEHKQAGVPNVWIYGICMEAVWVCVVVTRRLGSSTSASQTAEEMPLILLHPSLSWVSTCSKPFSAFCKYHNSPLSLPETAFFVSLFLPQTVCGHVEFCKSASAFLQHLTPPHMLMNISLSFFFFSAHSPVHHSFYSSCVAPSPLLGLPTLVFTCLLDLMGALCKQDICSFQHSLRKLHSNTARVTLLRHKVLNTVLDQFYI